MNRKGFTLLEMVVAVTILAAIAGILAASIRLAAASIERGETQVAKMGRLKAVIDVLERAIRSTDPTPIPAGDNAAPYFRGEGNRLRFLSLAPASPVPGRGFRLFCLFQASGANGEGLAVADASPFRAGGADAWEGTQGSRLLLAGATAVRFSYSEGPSPNGSWEWRDDWDSRESGRLPRGVRVEFSSPSEEGPLKTSLVVPIPAVEGGP